MPQHQLEAGCLAISPLHKAYLVNHDQFFCSIKEAVDVIHRIIMENWFSATAAEPDNSILKHICVASTT